MFKTVYFVDNVEQNLETSLLETQFRYNCMHCAHANL